MRLLLFRSNNSLLHAIVISRDCNYGDSFPSSLFATMSINNEDKEKHKAVGVQSEYNQMIIMICNLIAQLILSPSYKASSIVILVIHVLL